MGKAIFITLLVLMLNLSAAALTPFTAGTEVGTNFALSSQNTTQKVQGLYSNTASVNSPIDDNSLIWYRLLDIINFSWVSKIKDFVNNSIFGLPTLLTSLGLIDATTVGWMTTILVLIYIFGVIDLFIPNRNITKN